MTCNFTEGDYVLWSRADSRLSGTKLMVTWVGPFKVIEALSHSFIIKHLITGDEFDVHGSRLKFYADNKLNVSGELVEHIGEQGIILGVEQIKDHRYNSALKIWQVLVSWQGLQDLDDSWEPFKDMYRDVPNKVMEYVNLSDGAQEMLSSIE